MEIKNLIIGLVIVCLVVLGLGSIFFPIYTNPTYNVQINQSKFNTFNQTSKSFENIANKTFKNIQEMEANKNFISNAFGWIDLFASNIWSSAKIIFYEVPIAFYNMLNLVSSEIGIPNWIIGLIFVIILFLVIFEIYSIFLKPR
jgi:hypothetical protein